MEEGVGIPRLDFACRSGVSIGAIEGLERGIEPSELPADVGVDSSAE